MDCLGHGEWSLEIWLWGREGRKGETTGGEVLPPQPPNSKDGMSGAPERKLAFQHDYMPRGGPTISV